MQQPVADDGDVEVVEDDDDYTGGVVNVHVRNEDKEH